MWLREQVLGALNLFRCSPSATAWATCSPTRWACAAGLGTSGRQGGAGPDCLVLDELVLQGRLYGLPPEQARGRGRDLLGQLDLTGTERRLAGALSGGQRRRLDIAMGLMHVPGLLFMDEPTTGWTRRAGQTCGATSASCAPSTA